MDQKKIKLKKMDDIDRKYHTFRRKVQKLGIKIHKLFNLSNLMEKVSYENEAISVCRQVIRMSDSELFMTPRTSKRIIRNSKLGINIILKNHTIHIYDNKIPYPTQLTEKAYEYIINFFDDEIEKRRENMENEIENDVKIVLKSMFKKISEYEKI